MAEKLRPQRTSHLPSHLSEFYVTEDEITQELKSATKQATSRRAALKASSSRRLPYRAPLPKVLHDPDPAFICEEKKRRMNPVTGSPEVLVHWTGYSASLDEWIPASDIVVERALNPVRPWPVPTEATFDYRADYQITGLYYAVYAELSGGIKRWNFL